ncbi:hypothetical protein ABZ357_21740 [Streptomyces sp. NPDC005917]|uniref:hypothetical protein n=1 Tax=unclassified Streptomyces TaxID=2593676 RepID=UPI0033E274EC
MRHRSTGARSLAVVALTVSSAACASGTGATGPAKTEPSVSASARSWYGSPTPDGSSASGSPVLGSTSPGRSISASPSTRAATAGGSTRLCLSGTVTILYPLADNPLRTTCVHAGTAIHITLKSPPNYSWAPVMSSNPNTVTMLADHLAPDGTRSATARAVAAPGTATLNSADTYTPDHHGPPSRAWQLTLTVVP